MFCCTLLYVHSSFAINLMGKRERAGCFAWFVLLVSRECCVTLPRGAVGLSAVCVIVVFPDHARLLFLLLLQDDRVCLLTED